TVLLGRNLWSDRSEVALHLLRRPAVDGDEDVALDHRRARREVGRRRANRVDAVERQQFERKVEAARRGGFHGQVVANVTVVERREKYLDGADAIALRLACLDARACSGEFAIQIEAEAFALVLDRSVELPNGAGDLFEFAKRLLVRQLFEVAAAFVVGGIGRV